MEDDDALYLPVLLGTVRRGRASEHVATYVVERLERQPGVETRLVDPRELPFGNLKAREWEMDPRPPEVARFVADMGRADGFLVVTPEYNHGLPGALKNLFDHLYDEWNRKPFAVVSCGGVSGGLRAVGLLRQVVAGLAAVSVPKEVPVQRVGKVFGPEGPREDQDAWAKRIDGLAEELAWYARALKAAREQQVLVA